MIPKRNKDKLPSTELQRCMIVIVRKPAAMFEIGIIDIFRTSVGGFVCWVFSPKIIRLHPSV